MNHLERSIDNLAVTSNRQPRKLDNREAAPRGYNTAKDVVMGGELPHISQTFKKASNLVQEDQSLKRKANDDGNGEEIVKKQKKVKK